MTYIAFIVLVALLFALFSRYYAYETALLSLPAILVVGLTVLLNIWTTSRARRAVNIKDSLIAPEAVVATPARGIMQPVLGLGTTRAGLEIYRDNEIVINWPWDTITDISVEMACANFWSPIQVAAITIYRGDESDTFFVTGSFGILNSTRAIVLADNLRRFSG